MPLYALYFLIGALSGGRALTPIAVIAWMAYTGHLHLAGWTSFLANIIAVVIFTIMALGELVGDKLPTTPSRLAPPGLIARFVLGGLCGAALALSTDVAWFGGFALGAIGGLVGSYVGYHVRTGTVKATKLPDLAVALAEDAFVIACSIAIVMMIPRGV